MKPWERPGVKVYWPEPVPGIQYDRKERKFVDPSTGEFLITRPGSGPDPANQFVFGNIRDGILGSGGYDTGWKPEDRVSIVWIKSVYLKSQPRRALSRSEFDAAAIARMFGARGEVAADPIFAEIRRRSPPVKTVVIDSRPENPIEN
jgi:hypothetical protein